MAGVRDGPPVYPTAVRALAAYLPWKRGAAPDLRAAAPALLAALGYYLAVRFGAAFKLQPYTISLLWPANALLLSALLFVAPRRWWIVLAAVLPAHLLAQAQNGVAMPMALGWFASNCSEALIGAGLVRALIRWPEPLRFDSFREAGIVLLAAAVAAPFLSSFLDAALVRWIGGSRTAYLELIQVRFFSNVLSALVVVPLVLTLAALRRAPLRQAPPQRHAEAAAVLGGAALASFVIFDVAAVDPSHAPALYYLPLPFLLWAAVRLGPAGTSVAVALMAVTAIWGAVRGDSPFAGASPMETARALQVFLVAASAPLLLLSVVLEERVRAALESSAQREQLTHLSRVAMLGDMSGGLAHELNQPLTAILSNAQAAQHLLANKATDDAELGEILRDIIAADQRAGEVIQRLRAMFRRGDTHFEPLDPNQLVREALKLAHGDLVTRGVDTALELQDGLPAVQGDRVQLEQVMLNLTMNAADAMARGVPGERLLEVRSRAEDGEARLSFTDCGAGFKADQAEKLFEPFYTTKPQGLGLGLSISRSIVVAHGGRLWGAPNARRGATFHLVLPAAGGARPGPR